LEGNWLDSELEDQRAPELDALQHR
jgi:hypothetical protein